MSLTPRQEKFCQLYMELGNATEAYRQAGYSGKAKAESLHVKASQLLSTDKVSVRISELRKDLEQRHLWRREDSVRILSEIAQGHDEESKPSDRVNAVKALNAMHGWDKQVVDHTSSDGSMTPKAVTRIELVSLSDNSQD